jgi:hypothetical protein
MQDSIHNPIYPKGAIGYPNREPDFDVLPGFQKPPRGYGQVPFYWWVGDKLQKDRLIWQLDKLKEKGICGLQVNYPHFASMPETGHEGWPTCPGDPAVFSEEWWELWCWYVAEVKKRDMAVGLSDYTIHWDKSPYYMEDIEKIPGIQGTKLNVQVTKINAPEIYQLYNARETINLFAYPCIDELPDYLSGINLIPLITEDGLAWKAPEGRWEIVHIWGTPTPLDPMNPMTGNAIVHHFLKVFEDKSLGESGKTLNYFFQDEERMRGEERFPWNAVFPEYFKQKKGYDITPYLPALFMDIGDISPKIRLDYHDVKSELIGNGYFRPIFEWCRKHGMIFGADNNGRGLEPDAYGDYFRTQRYITAPGNDTPDRRSDLIKEKVNSSIAVRQGYSICNHPEIA